MIHHLFIVHRAPWAVSEYVVPTAEEAARHYVKDNGMCSPARYTIPVWQDTTFAGYVQVNVVADAIVESLFIEPPPCHEPIPAPVVQPPPPPSAVQRFKACEPADREAPIMALEKRVRSLGAEAEAYRDVGNDAHADILMGQQTAVLAALNVLRALHKEAPNG
jgi:hypothetical protein